MPKRETLEAALLARRADPRALRGALTFVKGKPRLTFGVVGEHKRLSIEVHGNDLVVVDDPRSDVAGEVDEAPAGDGSEGQGSDAAETGGNQGEVTIEGGADAPGNVLGNGKPETAAEKKARRKAEREAAKE